MRAAFAGRSPSFLKFGLPCADLRRLRSGAQTFLTLLSAATAPALEALLSCHILKGLRASELSRAPPEPPGTPGTHVLFEQYWLEAGPNPLPDESAPDEFVLTPSVRQHLATLARAALLRRHPILLQARAHLLAPPRTQLGSPAGSAMMQKHSSN
jgi:midasin (ATPase involved in ribosome maturation)